jgi:4-hydroxybenzoate polyprenyltransferase
MFLSGRSDLIKMMCASGGRYPSTVTTAASQPTDVLPKGVSRSLRLMAGDIKLAHSVFALPFALFAAFIAGPNPAANPGPTASDWLGFLAKLGLIVVCMVLARTWAMLVNRLVDRRLDAANARTSKRVFASGALSPVQGWIVALSCAALLVLVAGVFAWQFKNPWPVRLSVPVLAWLAFYSLTKRFTALCHLVLGASLAASPLAAALAVRSQSVLGPNPNAVIWWLAVFVLLWVAGFDVIYALQDESFDKGKGLKSIPAALGSKAARVASMALHTGAALSLVAAWTSTHRLGPIFGAGIGAVLVLLVTEHIVVTISARRGLAGLNVAFFTLNGVVSCVLGALGIADLFIN